MFFRRRPFGSPFDAAVTDVERPSSSPVSFPPSAQAPSFVALHLLPHLSSVKHRSLSCCLTAECYPTASFDSYRPRIESATPFMGFHNLADTVPLENDRVGSLRNNDRLLVRPLGPPGSSRRRARGRWLIAPDATLMTGPARRNVMTKFGKWFRKNEAPSS